MSPPEAIFTAIEFTPYMDDDNFSMVTEPLLGDAAQGLALNEGADEENVSSLTAKKGTVSPFGFIALGTLTGFLIQVVSLGAYAFMLTQYGEITESSASEGEWFVYGVLSVLTQVDLVLYVLIWMAFTCTMTRNGMKFIRGKYQMPVKRRSVFLLGVYFLVGIVLGAFLAWTMIDVYLGFPIPFVPIAMTVVADLVLCYLMVFCYDLGGRSEAAAKEEAQEEEGISDSCC